MATQKVSKSKATLKKAKVGTTVPISTLHADIIQYGGMDFADFLRWKRVADLKQMETWNAIARQFGYADMEALHEDGLHMTLNTKENTAIITPNADKD